MESAEHGSDLTVIIVFGTANLLFIWGKSWSLNLSIVNITGVNAMMKLMMKLQKLVEYSGRIFDIRSRSSCLSSFQVIKLFYVRLGCDVEDIDVYLAARTLPTKRQTRDEGGSCILTDTLQSVCKWQSGHVHSYAGSAANFRF